MVYAEVEYGRHSHVAKAQQVGTHMTETDEERAARHERERKEANERHERERKESRERYEQERKEARQRRDEERRERDS